MKQPLKVTIDEKVLEMVKDNIPNISKFVEDCFKAYLSFAIETEEERGEELRKAWSDFNKAKLSIHLLMKVNYENNDLERVVAEQKTDAWLDIWKDYRRVGNTQESKLEKSAKTLNIETDILKQLLHDTLYEYQQDMTKAYIFDNWKYIEDNILPHVEIDDEEEFDLDAILNG